MHDMWKPSARASNCSMAACAGSRSTCHRTVSDRCRSNKDRAGAGHETPAAPWLRVQAADPPVTTRCQILFMSEQLLTS